MDKNNAQKVRTLKVQITDVPDLIKVCELSKNNLLIIGNPGTGKSTMIKGMEQEGYKVTMLTGSSTYEETVNGIPYRDNSKKSTCGNDISVYNVPKWLEDIAHYDDKQILFIDEFNTADPQVLKTFLSILTDRKVPTQPEELQIPDNCTIVAAMNPADQNDGEQLIRPLKSRFMTVEIISTLNDFKKYISSKTYENIDKDKIVELVEQLDRDVWGQEYSYTELNPRSFTNFLNALDAGIGDGGKPETICPNYSLAFFGQALDYPTKEVIETNKKERKLSGNQMPTLEELQEMKTEELKDLYDKMITKFTEKANKVCLNISNILTTRNITGE